MFFVNFTVDNSSIRIRSQDEPRRIIQEIQFPNYRAHSPMAKVTYNGQSYECEGQSVLECLLAKNIPVPFSCRAGLCQGCMMRAISGKVPEKAKAWLSDSLVAQNHFLPCVCYPEEDMEVMFPNMEELFEHMLSGRIDMNHP